MMTPKGLLFNIQKFSLHDGPGIRTVVFFQGCPLSCYWCSNPESQTADPSGRGGADARNSMDATREYDLEETLAICLQDRPFYDDESTQQTSPGTRGGVTLSGGEVLAQPEFAAALLRVLKSEGIHTAIETSGYAPPDVFREVTAAADLLLFDIKHYDDRRHAEGTGVHHKLILDNLKSALTAGKAILPRIPVIPGFNNAPEDAQGFARLLTSLGCKNVQLLPFHQFGEKKYETLQIPYALRGVPQLHPEDLEAYRKIFLDTGIDCFF
jgi:pyruvate formate lyase activating enzyme